tara:strand:- start:51 stop:359 length:309 start_codon:yes stop_codon:yes gene_type:complete
MSNFKSTFLAKSPLNQEIPPEEAVSIYNDRLNSKGESQRDKLEQANDEASSAVSNYNNSDNKSELYAATLAANKRPGIVRDSINNANVKIDKLISNIKAGDY